MRGGRFALMMRRPALPRFGADDVPMEKPPPAGAGGAWALKAKPGVAGGAAAPNAGAAGAAPNAGAAGAPPVVTVDVMASGGSLTIGSLTCGSGP